MNGLFWKVCAVWLLLLGTYIVARPFLGDDTASVSSPQNTMPSIGDRVELPTTLTTRAGDVIPSVGRDGKTFYLVASTSCPVCQREVVTHYPDLLPMAVASGFAVRLLAISGSPVEDEWFLDRTPPDTHVVLDTLGIAVSGLRVRVTPSVVVLTSDGTVEGVFSPSREWPVTQELLAQFQ